MRSVGILTAALLGKDSRSALLVALTIAKLGVDAHFRPRQPVARSVLSENGAAWTISLSA